MDSKILEMTSYFKNVSKQKVWNLQRFKCKDVWNAKILSNFRRKTAFINEDDFKLTLETSVATNTFMLRNSYSYTSHNFSDNTILAPETLETFT